MAGRYPDIPRLRKLALFIRDFTEHNGYPPSILQMGGAVTASSSLVAYYLKDLKERGVIDYVPRLSRTARVLPNVDLDKLLPRA